MRMEKRWFLLSVLSLGVGGFLAFVVAMARTPGVYQYFPPGYFYHALTGHVDLAIVVFLLSFTVLLWNRVFSSGYSISFYLAFLGFLGIAIASLLGKGKAVSNNYLPTIVHPVFFLGALSFFTGFWLEAFRLIKTSLKHLTSEEPLKNSLATSVVLAVLMLIALIFSSFKTGSHEELYLFYERLYWAPGHIHQFLNGAVLLYAWYYLLTLLGFHVSLGNLRYVNLSFVAFGLLLAFIPLLFKDPVSYSAKLFTEISYAVGLGIPMFIHAFNVLRSYKVERKNLYSVAIMLSLILYFLGVAIAYLGIKADLRVPAHYHGTVTSLTLALMAISYHLLKDYRIRERLSSITNLQVYLYGVGMVLFILGLYLAGKGGAPRKTYGTEYTESFFVLSALVLMGVGTVMAVIAGVIFVVYVLSGRWKSYEKG